MKKKVLHYLSMMDRKGDDQTCVYVTYTSLYFLCEKDFIPFSILHT